MAQSLNRLYSVWVMVTSQRMCLTLVPEQILVYYPNLNPVIGGELFQFSKPQFILIYSRSGVTSLQNHFADTEILPTSAPTGIWMLPFPGFLLSCHSGIVVSSTPRSFSLTSHSRFFFLCPVGCMLLTLRHQK